MSQQATNTTKKAQRSCPHQTVLARMVNVDGETHYIPVTEDLHEVKLAQKSLRKTVCEFPGEVLVPLRIWPGKIAEEQVRMVVRMGGRVVRQTVITAKKGGPVPETTSEDPSTRAHEHEKDAHAKEDGMDDLF